MKKIIRLTESDIHRIVLNTAKTILRERHVLKVPHNDDDMMGEGPMMGGGMSPMDGGPNAMGGADPMGGGDQMMNDEDMPPMDDETNMGGDDAPDFWSKLNTKQKAAVEKYAESMIDDDSESEDDESMPPMGDDPDMNGGAPNTMGGEGPNAMGGGAPMQEQYFREFNNLSMQDRPQKREDKNIPEKRKKKFSPFKVNR